MSLGEVTGPDGSALLGSHLGHERALVLTQVPVRAWEPVLELARARGAVTVYDCIDRWDSELGRGWYRHEAERRIARGSDVLVASAAELLHHVERLAEREALLLPNAYNSRVFRADAEPPRPADMPAAERVALYVGALWGGWLDWELVGAAARALPGTTFVFVGDRRREGRGLPSNCVFLGLKPQTDLPGYLAHADVAFLPWHADEVTQATSPLKVFEFVAMGLPVVAPDIETLHGIPGVRRFEDASGFIELLGATSRAGLHERTRRDMADFAASSSWVRRVDDLLSWVERAPIGSGGAPAAHASRDRTTPARTDRAMLSVVIPSYNHARWIGRAVESVREQTLPAGEVVVVDDGSSDRSAEVVAESRFPGLRLIRQENRGAHAAINRGVALSRGDYVAVLNSDDELTPARLEHAWGVARSTGAALVVGSVLLIDADGEPLPEDHDSSRWYREARAEPGRSPSLARALLRHNFAVTTSNFFFHKELWRKLGGFAPYRYVHDLDFILRAVELCRSRVVYAEELEGVRYRVHGGNTILEDVERALGERDAMLRRIRSPLRRVRALLTRPGTRAAVRRAVERTDDPVPLPPTGPAGGSDGVSGAVPSHPLRVGLVVPSLGHGGLEEVVALLAQTLPAHGLEPSVLCTHTGGPVADRLASAGVYVTVASGRPEEWTRWLADASPEVLSTHFADLDVVDVLAGSDAPIFETVHNTYAWFGAAEWARETEKLRRVTGTVAVSDLVAEYHARFTATDVTPHVIPNGVHPARAASVPRAWARKRLGLPAGAPVLAHLGRVTLQKNVVGLLDAFAEVLRREPAAHLVLAGALGDKAYVRRVRRIHRSLLRSGSVHLLPPVPHVGTVLSAADAYVSDSYFEGWSLAASEAAWNGLPLVLSDCGSARQLVGAHGERGHSVPNPLGEPLDVTWERLEALPAHPEAANRTALVEALLDVLGSRDEWAARRQEIVGRARVELAPERVGRAYAELFTRAVTP